MKFSIKVGRGSGGGRKAPGPVGYKRQKNTRTGLGKPAERLSMKVLRGRGRG